MDNNELNSAQQPINTEMGSVEGSHSTGSKKIISVIVILILICVAGITVFSRYRSTESTEQIFDKVFNVATSLKFVKEKVDGSFVLKDSIFSKQNNLPAGVYPKISFSSNMIASVDNWINYSGDAKASANIKLNFDNFTKDPISAEADFLMPKIMLYYIKLNELTGAPMDISSIKGKWWKVDIQALAKNFAGVEAEKILESAKKSQLSKEKIEQIKVIIQKYKEAIYIEKIADGKIEGTPAYHWNIVLDKVQLAPMLVEMSDIMQGDIVEKEEIKISDVEAALKMIKVNSLELFIQKRDYFPVQVKFSIEILDQDSKDFATLDMSLIIDKSGVVEIQAPADSTDILYLMGPIIQSSLETARQKGKEAALKAIL